MKNLHNFSEFILEQNDRSKPKTDTSNVQKPGIIKRFFGLDKAGDYKIGPAKSKPTVGNVVIRNNKFRLTTIRSINPTEEKKIELKKKGWIEVWEEEITSETKLPVETEVVAQPSQIQFPTGTDYFILGGFTLTDTIKEIIQKEFSLFPPGSQVDKIQIESSTDKVQVTKQLQNLLSQKGYKPTNEGLSNARANAIKNYLIEVGGNKITEANFSPNKILFEQGKENPGPEGDPSARWVKITVTLKPEPIKKIEPGLESKENKIFYYQKIFSLPKPCFPKSFGSKTCFTYS